MRSLRIFIVCAFMMAKPIVSRADLVAVLGDADGFKLGSIAADGSIGNTVALPSIHQWTTDTKIAFNKTRTTGYIYQDNFFDGDGEIQTRPPRLLEINFADWQLTETLLDRNYAAISANSDGFVTGQVDGLGSFESYEETLTAVELEVAMAGIKHQLRFVATRFFDLKELTALSSEPDPKLERAT